jgi:hypothetical protein
MIEGGRGVACGSGAVEAVNVVNPPVKTIVPSGVGTVVVGAAVVLVTEPMYVERS